MILDDRAKLALHLVVSVLQNLLKLIQHHNNPGSTLPPRFRAGVSRTSSNAGRSGPAGPSPNISTGLLPRRRHTRRKTAEKLPCGRQHLLHRRAHGLRNCFCHGSDEGGFAVRWATNPRRRTIAPFGQPAECGAHQRGLSIAPLGENKQLFRVLHRPPQVSQFPSPGLQKAAPVTTPPYSNGFLIIRQLRYAQCVIA